MCRCLYIKVEILIYHLYIFTHDMTDTLSDVSCLLHLPISWLTFRSRLVYIVEALNMLFEEFRVDLLKLIR